MALPGHPRRGGRRVRRAQGRRPAVLRPRDRHHRPRRSTRTTTSWRRSGSSAATSCPPGAAPAPTRPPVERAFGVIRQLLFEHLPGYAGVDVADRGADPEADATLTMDEMEHLIATLDRRRSGKTGSWANTPRHGIPAGPAQPELAVRRRRSRRPGSRCRSRRRTCTTSCCPPHYVSIARPPRGEDPRPLV